MKNVFKIPVKRKLGFESANTRKMFCPGEALDERRYGLYIWTPDPVNENATAHGAGIKITERLLRLCQRLALPAKCKAYLAR